MLELESRLRSQFQFLLMCTREAAVRAPVVGSLAPLWETELDSWLLASWGHLGNESVDGNFVSACFSNK